MKPNVKKTKFVWGAGLAAGLGLVATMGGQALADTCESLATASGKKLFYMSGSSAFQPTLAQLALKLSDYFVVYQSSSSGAGANDIAGDADLASAGGAFNSFAVPGAGDSAAQIAAGWKAVPCTLDPSSPAPRSQIGVSDVHPSNFGLTADVFTPSATAKVQVATGPVQAMLFISKRTATTAPAAISAEQAHALLGGCTTATFPWTETFDRGAGSGTQVMISKYIGTPATFAGPGDATHHGLGGGPILTALNGSMDTSNALAILAADSYDTGTTAGMANKTLFKALAFQAFRQTKAYYPDSTPTGASDRRNVRDGHYVIQGPVHFSARVNPSADVAAVLGYLTGSKPVGAAEADNKSYVTAVSKAGMIPTCAMKVKRDAEGGYLSPYTPAKACGCYFETLVVGATGAPTSCVSCDDATPCAGGKSCNYGFCE